MSCIRRFVFVFFCFLAGSLSGLFSSLAFAQTPSTTPPKLLPLLPSTPTPASSTDTLPPPLVPAVPSAPPAARVPVVPPPPAASTDPFAATCRTILASYAEQIDRLQATPAPPDVDGLLRSLKATETDFRGCFRSTLGRMLLLRRVAIERDLLKLRQTKPNQEYLDRMKKRQASKMLKEQRWQQSRFFWSVEIGGFFHTFQPFSPSPPTFRAYDFLGATFGGRWGYATGNFIFTGDIGYGIGEERFMVQLGGTFGILLNPYFILDLGSGIHFLFLSQGMDDPEVRVPLDLGFTARFQLGNLSLGFRVVASTAFDVSRGGISLSLRSMLTFGSF